MKAYKTCKCCKREYTTEQAFINSTKFVGIQSFSPYNLMSLELRDCSCGTTLAIKMSPSLESELIAA